MNQQEAKKKLVRQFIRVTELELGEFFRWDYRGSTFGIMCQAQFNYRFDGLEEISLKDSTRKKYRLWWSEHNRYYSYPTKDRVVTGDDCVCVRRFVEIPARPFIKKPKLSDGIKPSKRFNILQRDNFKCNLCGKSANDGVILEVDHKHPRSKGGTDDDENLWTLCFDCNRGKHAKLLQLCA